MSNNGNTFGTNFKVTTFGESHGVALGCIVDGCPAGLTITPQIIQKALDRRRPGASADGKLNASVNFEVKKIEKPVIEISNILNLPIYPFIDSSVKSI